MKNNQLIIGIILAVVLFIAGFFFVSKKPSTTGNESITNNIFSSGKTAKAAYQTALIEAKKRKNDSYLVDINAHVDSKGESENWYAEFYSPSSKEQFRIIMKNGRVTQVQTKKTLKTNPVGDNWIDNGQIMGAALKECGQVTENKYFISLNKINKLRWGVNCKVGENKTLYVDIDATTGKFIKTRKAGIGW